MQAPSLRECARNVSVHTVDGRTREGSVLRFDPKGSDIALLSLPGQPPRRELLHGESIALVAFHRQSAPSGPSPVRGARVRVHLVQGPSWLVDLRSDAPASPLGFWALPADPASPYEELFFYAHGVVARETIEAIGALLVREGALTEAQLSQGLEVQRASRPPLGKILVEQGAVSAATVDEALAQQPKRRLRLGEVLIEAGVVSEEQVNRALLQQRKFGSRRLGEVLVDLGFVDEATIARTLSTKFAMPFVDLSTTLPSAEALAEVSRELMQKFDVLPLATEPRSLTVAIADPAAVAGLDALRMTLKKRIVAVIAPPSQLRRAIASATVVDEEQLRDREMESLLSSLAEGGTADAQEEAAGTLQESDSAVIKLVNQMIADAYRRGASDIHIEPNGRGRGVVLRFRIDGDCLQYQEIPATYRSAIVARIKIMASLDIAERRKPQDGKIQFKVRERVIELRVATIPTVGGNEDVVMRILAGSKPLPLAQMGFSERNLRATQAVVEQPYGLILCVGPTGSGKTTTLHSMMGAINKPDLKIWTAEDPVEITQPGLRQVQVQPKIGFTFAVAMRAFLRADPDVIMVGEMRDKETAETAVEASLTGHLVFSTLHTNSAPETITRLVDMGLEPFSFSDALLGVLAQRLVRSLCRVCSVADEATAEEREELRLALGAGSEALLDGQVVLRRPKGCEACGHTGYKGRLGVHELLINDESIRHAIQTRMPVDEMRRIAIAGGGMTTLLQDGVHKVLAGLTDLKHVRAVCSR